MFILTVTQGIPVKNLDQSKKSLSIIIL